MCLMKVHGFNITVKRLLVIQVFVPDCLKMDDMSGIENFGLHCFLNSLVQCVSNFNGVVTQMREHSDMHAIPGKS